MDKFNSRLQQTPIAIVGMASIYANSENLESYWDTIIQGIDTIMDVPPSRWLVDDYYSADKSAPDKTYCKRGAFIPDIDFDPMEFGLPPNILELTDIAQLLSLVVARDVLNDAGIGEGSEYDRDKVGIVLGVGGGLKQVVPLTSRLQEPVLKKVLSSSGVSEKDQAMIIEKYKKAYIPWEENSFPGMLGNVIAGRIANRFDFGGTNCVVDAACAGSLAAMKLAINDLLDFRSEVMISGGVCCDNSPFMYMSFSKTPAFTDGDNIRPFDQDSKGMMIGEGIGMLAFKRLEDAERDGDKVYAVLKGMGSSSDGRFKSIYAPRSSGQAKALNRAYEDAGFDPSTVGLIEAHGTGTLAGDAAEFGGLVEAFSTNEDKQHIALGSVKSQVGHTKAAAGAAGMIKIALALHHKVLPPTINVDQPSDKLDVDNSPFYINTETRPWFKKASGEPRRAGISSFGFGGTNFHFVLEEYQGKQGAYGLQSPEQPFFLSAPNKNDLKAQLQVKLEALKVDGIYAFNQWAATETSVEGHRVGFVASTVESAISAVKLAIKQLDQDKDNWSLSSGIFYRSESLSDKKTAALFSGQGSQYVNMGKDLFIHNKGLQEEAHKLNQVFVGKGESQLSDVIYPQPVFDDASRKAQEETLRQTQHAQPAIGLISTLQFDTLKNKGLTVDFSAGHSFGELSALYAAGSLDKESFYALAQARGAAMAAKAEEGFDAGKMLAVIAGIEKVEAVIAGIDGVSVANINAHNQIVVAGTSDGIDKAQKAYEKQGFKAISLPVSAAFHTPLVEHAQLPFAQAVEATTFNNPAFPVFANTSGEAYPFEVESIKDQLKGQMLAPVEFVKQIEGLYEAGARVFIEFGPKNVLTKLTQSILKDKDVEIISAGAAPGKNDQEALAKAYCELKVLGFDLAPLNTLSAKVNPTKPRKLSKMAMKLNAASFVSDKTKQGFETALVSGETLTQAAPEVIEKIVEVEKIIEVEKPVAAMNKPSQPATVSTPVATPNTQQVDALISHQSELLKAHQSFMQSPTEYMKTMNQLVSQHNGQIPQDLQGLIHKLNDYQTQTLQVHREFLAMQAGQSVPAPMTAPAPVVTAAPIAAPVVSTPVSAPQPVVKPVSAQPAVQQEKSAPTPAAPVAAAVDVDAVMMQVVADKTGYPVDMLEAEMDMEADLGIDSIKRVEILGEIQEKLPNLPELNPEDLAELRTLGQISEHVQSKMGATASALQQSTNAEADGLSADIEGALLSIVAEKTGYQVDMLEPSMDMEADLGIDSIKRVEILGQVQDDIAGLPELSPETLAELRTLGEISAYIAGQMSSAAPAQLASAQPATLKAVPSTLDNDLPQLMRSIVAEKTGYPVDMIEDEMDLEADLGIDSIKRVEILGAVQEARPDLQEMNPEVMGEMRTLKAIMDYLVESSPAPSAAAVASSDAISTEQLTDVLLKVVSDKTGYPIDMLALEMDMEADLGIDSIKRVEILGGVQDALPGLPEADPEVLSEMRTLEAIVNYFADAASQGAVPVKKSHEAQDAASDETTAISVGGAELVPLGSVTQIAQSLEGAKVFLVGEAASHLVKPLQAKGAELFSVASVDGTQQIEAKAISEHTFNGCIIVDTAEEQAGAEINEPAFKQVEQAFYAATQLKLGAAEFARPFFVTVSQLGGHFGVEGNTNPLQGALAGLTKTVDQEYPEVFCRALDVDAIMPDAILAELNDVDSSVLEVGIKQGKRVSLGTQALRYETLEVKPCDANNVFVVSGGAKGVTALCVKALAERSKAHFVLLGRSHLADEPQWAAGVANDDLQAQAISAMKAAGEKLTPKAIKKMVGSISAAREIQATLADIEKVGGSATYLPVDITNQATLTDALAEIVKDKGEITGVIHGAGVLRDKYLKDKTLDDFNQVVGTKVRGLSAILQAIDLSKLQYLTLFSSAAGFYGNPGQSDYAMANEMLNKWACQFKAQHPECHVLSMNWGPWDGGMVTPEIKAMFKARGVEIIPEAIGATIMADAMTHENSHVVQVIGNSMRGEATNSLPSNICLTKAFNPEKNPFLQDHVIGSNPVLPTVCALAWMADAVEGVYKDYRFVSLSDYQLLKGIVVDGSDKADYQLELNLQDLSDEQLSVEVSIQSGSLKHYSAVCHMISNEKALEAQLQAVPSQEGEATDAADFYENGTLFHGESLQVIEQVMQLDKEGLLLRCKVPAIADEKAGEFSASTHNVFANDVAYQAMLIWVRENFGMGSLPNATASWKSYRQVSTGETFYVLLKVSESSKTKLKANIQLIDDKDTVIADIEAAEVTISERLNNLFSAA